MSTFCNLFRNLGNSLDLEETFSTLDGELRRLVEYEAISVHLVEDERLTPAYAAGEEFQALASLEMGIDEGFLGAAAESRRPSLNQRVTIFRKPAFALVMPLQHAGLVNAIVTLYHTGERLFKQDDLAVVAGAAEKLASAIENARQHRDAARLANVDPFTGLLNARSLFQRLDAEVARSRRSQSPVAVLQCAVEGWTGPVETFRPVIGRIAAGLRHCCREYDFAARTGDDFVLVLAGFTPAGLERKRARIQAIVEHAGLNAGLELSAHVGVAFFPENGSDTEDLLAAVAKDLQAVRGVAHAA